MTEEYCCDKNQTEVAILTEKVVDKNNINGLLL